MIVLILGCLTGAAGFAAAIFGYLDQRKWRKWRG